MLENKKIFQERVMSLRRAQFELKEEREERMKQMIKSRNKEREVQRKMIYFLKSEEERQTRLREEEEKQKLEGTFAFRICPIEFIE